MYFGVYFASLCPHVFNVRPRACAHGRSGVIFGIVDAPANSTIDQSSFYAKQVNKTFMGVPETDFTFQITFPTGGFSGMVTKPWNERERSVLKFCPRCNKT